MLRNSIFNGGLLNAFDDDDEIVIESDSTDDDILINSNDIWTNSSVTPSKTSGNKPRKSPQRIQEVIDFLEKKIDFFSSLFENFQPSSKWCEQNKGLSKGFFDALHDKLFKEFMVRAEFRRALVGNLEETTPHCLKNGNREKMQDWLSNNVELTDLIHKNINNPAIERWYNDHPKKPSRNISPIIEEVIDFIEEKIDFFIFSPNWTKKHTLFGKALIGDHEMDNSSGLKNGDRSKIKTFLSDNIALTHRLHKNMKHPAIEKWYRDNPPTKISKNSL